MTGVAPGPGPTNAAGQTPDSPWEYVGVGCFTAVAGLAGGWMIAILLAKFVGAVQRCPAEAETGAPCNWFTFAVFGALAGAVVLPTICIWLMRRGRRRPRNLAEETR